MDTSKETYARISFNDIPDLMDASVIKNFIISDSESRKEELSYLSFDYPYVIEGAAFSICVRGRARMKINLKECIIEENTIATISPGRVIEILERSDDFLMEFLFFSFDFISDLKIPTDTDILEKIEHTPSMKVSNETIQTLLEFHSFIVKQYKRVDHLYRVDMIKNLLSALMVEIMSIYQSSREKEVVISSHKEKLFNQFIIILIKNHRTERSITFYAGKMCLTPKYLAKIIKEISKKSALEWINEMVILSIKALLKSSNMTVLQISEKLNFTNPSFFGRFFKKHTGMTPVEYRES